MRKACLVVVVALGISVGSAGAQQSLPERPGATSPEWSTWVGAVAFLANAFTLDASVRGAGPADASPSGLARWAYGVGNLSDLWPYALGATAVGTLLDRDAPRTALEMSAGVLAAATAGELLKRAAGRERPRTTTDPFRFDPFGSNRSFPSGHTVAAFAFAGAVAAETDRWWIRAGALGLAGLVGCGRVAADAHWASDVVMGAALGAAIGYRTTAWLRSGRARAEPAPGLVPVVLGDAIGLGVRAPLDLTSAF